jgi:hypothetical protein
VETSWSRPLHSMNNADRVPAVRKSHGADGQAIAQQIRKLSIRARLSIRDCLQQVPHRLLEGRSV